MSKEKQIEKMAHCLCGQSNCAECVSDYRCEFLAECGVLHKAGYRKQSEVATDIKVGNKAEWISVEERLPEEVYGKQRKRITVLVCTESGKVSTASRQRTFHFDKTKLEWQELDTFEWNHRKRVTHWMPLPEPTKGE